MFNQDESTKQYIPVNNTDLALKQVGFSFAALLLVLLVYKLKALIVCLLLAMTLASALAPVAETAQKKMKIPRMVTLLTLYVVAGLIYGLLGVSIVPAIHEQWQKLYEHLPVYFSGLELLYQHVLSFAGTNAGALTLSVEDLRTLSLKLFRQTLDMSAGVLGLVLNAILVFFLAGYFVVEADKIWTSILRWLPKNASHEVARLIVPISQRMGGYVRGQILVAISVGAILITGFSLLGLKYALLLGVLGGTLNLVPFIGSLIAVSFAVVVAFNQTPVLALAVLLFYAVEQWTESSFLVPHLLGKNVSLHPLIVLLVILVGATLMGVPGALISVPISAAAMFLAEEFYLKASEAKEENE